MALTHTAVLGTLRFGDDFELDVRAYQLRSGGTPLKLKPIAMELLLFLVERRGQLVTREQIVERIWGKGVFLDTDNSINGAMSKIRQALRDNAERPRFVETVTGKGYRFVAPVVEVLPPPPPVTVLEERPPTDTFAGKKVSHYRILQVLGGGGMGVVYMAEDLKLGRRVAIKFLPGEMANDPKAFDHLEREARAASALEHPNICPIYELGEHEGQPFIVMQLLEGQTLREKIESNDEQKPLPTNEVLDLAIQVGAALEAAHEKGIIHRDIKPANIFITKRGEVKILDFGLAKIVAHDLANDLADDRVALTEASSTSAPPAVSSLRLTRTGTTVGTAQYMSPEQVRGESLDARTDLFSFGLVLYEMVTGQRAFAGNTVAVIHDAILNQTLPSIEQFNHEISPGLEPIITKALEKDRTLRYQRASDMRTDLQRLKEAPETKSLPEPSTPKAAVLPTPALGVENLWKIAVPVVVIILAAVGFYYRSHRQSKSLTDKDTVVVTYFANHTGDQIFDDTLKTALSVSLRQSPFLNVLSDDKVAATLKLMARPSTTAVTPEVARELCQRTGSKAYVAGSIASLGSEYVLDLRAVSCTGGDTLAQEQVTAAGKEKLLGALGEAASRLRSELGESIGTVQKFDVPLAEATTSSLEALKAYSLGLREIDATAAIAHLQRAIQLDPDFAMGYYALGNKYESMGQVERASEYFTKAFQLRNRASEYEKLKISAEYYSSVTGELDKAAQSYREITDVYPRNSDAYGGLIWQYLGLGQFEKAEEAGHEASRLTPDSIIPYINLSGALVSQRRLAEARLILDQAQARKLGDELDGLSLHTSFYELAFMQGDSPTMLEHQKWLVNKPEFESYGLGLASDTEAYAGRVSNAQQLTSQAVDSAVRADNREFGATWQEHSAVREAAFGKAAEAKRLASEGLKLSSKSQAVQVEAALAFAMAGDAPRAESLVKQLNQRFPLDTQMQSLWLPAIRAQLSLSRKNPGRALTELPAPSQLEFGLIQFANSVSCLFPTYIRAQVYLSLGQGRQSAAEFQKILDNKGIVGNCCTGALAHLGLARANALQVRALQGTDADAARVRALAAYKDFFTLWKDADPDIPILKQAMAEYAKLNY